MFLLNSYSYNSRSLEETWEDSTIPFVGKCLGYLDVPVEQSVWGEHGKTVLPFFSKEMETHTC